MPKDLVGLCKDDMEVLGLYCKKMHSLEINEGGLRGQPANPGSSGKMAVKTVYASVHVLQSVWHPPPPVCRRNVEVPME